MSWCSRRRPHLPRRQRIHDLAFQQFKEKLRKFQATPVETLEQDDLMELLEPMLRADFFLSETHNFRTTSGPTSSSKAPAVLSLTRDIGFDAVSAGPLQNARWLETLGYLNIQLGYVVGLGTKTGRYVH